MSGRTSGRWRSRLTRSSAPSSPKSRAPPRRRRGSRQPDGTRTHRRAARRGDGSHSRSEAPTLPSPASSERRTSPLSHRERDRVRGNRQQPLPRFITQMICAKSKVFLRSVDQGPMRRTSPMPRSTTRCRAAARAGLALGLLVLFLSAGAGGDAAPDLEFIAQPARMVRDRALAWYRTTAPADRVTWGGLAACAGLGLGVMLERLVRLRRQKIVPRDFTSRFLARLSEGKLDRGKALDFCELNPSPAARVALGAVRRWD